MGYLVNLLQAGPREGQGSRSFLADSAPEGVIDFIRALFAAGAAPGEARASVAEALSPPRVAA
eukprot:5715273-Alexandrium_andersonii.AAC.1